LVPRARKVEKLERQHDKTGHSVCTRAGIRSDCRPGRR
jgi:hypothetical protein